MGLWNRTRKITISDDTVTSAAQLTLKQSLIPNLLGKGSHQTNKSERKQVFCELG